MKFKIFAAAIAALAMGALAQTASAHDYRDFRTDWRRSGDEIVVRQDGRTMAFDRGDRLFYRLMDRPFNFVPGLTYAYTNDCNRFGCRVIVLAPRSHLPVNSLFAPRIFDRFAGWDRDRRYDDGRYDDDRRYDDRNYDDDRLYGAPR